MSQSVLQQIHTDSTLSPMALLTIILMVMVIHVFAVIIALSVTPKDPPKINVLQAQILSAADARQLVHHQSAPKSRPAKSVNSAAKRHFQPIKPKYHAPITQDVSDMGQMPTYDTPVSTPTFEPSEPIDTPNLNADTVDKIDTLKPKTAPSASLKKAAQSATARVMAAWQNYDNIGGKKLMVIIELDDMGNVLNVRAGKGDQELAQNAIAAVHDAAPFNEVAGLTNKLTIQFISTESSGEQ